MSVRWVPDTCPVKEPPVVTDSIRISQLSAGRMSDKCQVRVSGHLSGGTGGRGSVSRFAAPSLHKAAGTRGLVKRGGGRYGLVNQHDSGDGSTLRAHRCRGPEGGDGHLGRSDRNIGLERRPLTNCSGLTTVPKTVPTPSTKPCAVVAVAYLMTGGFTPENIAQYSVATLSAFGSAVTTNQEAAGSSPAGRANLFMGFWRPCRSGNQKCGYFCGCPPRFDAC